MYIAKKKIGNDLDKYKVTINKEWGDFRKQDSTSIKNKITALKNQIKVLETYLK